MSIVPASAIERISIELTNRCQKACWFCYNHSQPQGATEWTPKQTVAFVSDCADHGVQAVSFGGGEPLQYDGTWQILTELRGRLFRSLTTNGLLLDQEFSNLLEAAPDKVHVSIHFPQNEKEVARVIAQVVQLESSGIRSGVNLLVAQSNLNAAYRAAGELRDAGIANDRIVYLPMRGQDTPTPKQISQVAGGKPFQSMSCLTLCERSPRFCSIGWDKTVAWCSYTTARAPLERLTYSGLSQAVAKLGLIFCGATHE